MPAPPLSQNRKHIRPAAASGPDATGTSRKPPHSAWGSSSRSLRVPRNTHHDKHQMQTSPAWFPSSTLPDVHSRFVKRPQVEHAFYPDQFRRAACCFCCCFCFLQNTNQTRRPKVRRTQSHGDLDPARAASRLRTRSSTSGLTRAGPHTGPCPTRNSRATASSFADFASEFKYEFELEESALVNSLPRLGPPENSAAVP